MIDQKSEKSQKFKVKLETIDESEERSSTEDVNEFNTNSRAESTTSGKATKVTPFGTTFYVYAEVHRELPEVQFIVDTGAGVSLLPQAVYEQIPLEDRQPLSPTERHVFCGNDQGIRIAGIAFMSIRLQNIEYQAAFHITPDVRKGILGSDFLERYDAHLQVAQRKLAFNNRSINVYDARGLPLKRRVIAERTVHVPPGVRYVLPGKIVGKGLIEEAPFMVEGAKRLATHRGVLVARVITKHKNYRLMLEVTNLTDRTQTIGKNTTIGLVREVDGIEQWQEPPAPEKTAEQEAAEKFIREHEEPPELMSSDDDDSDEEEEDDWTEEIARRPEEPPDLVDESSTATSSEGESEAATQAKKRAKRYTKRRKKPPDRTLSNEDWSTSFNRMFTKRREQRLPQEQSTSKQPTSNWSCKEVLQEHTKEIPPINVEELPEHVRQMYLDNTKEVTSERDKYCFFRLIREYADIFAKDRYDLGRTDLAKHHIDTGNSAPVKQKPRRLPHAHHAEIREQVEKLAETGIIKPSTSNYASNVLLVRKKDGTWRLCIDYRELNSKTVNKDPYMIPRIDDTLDALSGAKLFCTLDLAQGYHQVELTDGSKAKTAFLTPHMTPSLWEFDCMPFGITGGPASFQRVMDRLLEGMDHRIALAYLDDIIVYGGTYQEVMDRLAQVFERIRHAGLKLKPKKCAFFQKETLYLGHIVSEDGIRCDPKKIEKVKNYPRPQTRKQCLRFAGFANYYNRFIKNFSEKAQPLYALGQQRGPNRKPFKWTEVEEKAFQELKEALISDPVLAFPTRDGEWILDTDASANGMGGVLAQMQEDKEGEMQERVIAYGSRVLQGRQKRYCTRRRELLAVVTFVQHFRPYLYGRFVKIRTDHASLRYLKTLNNPDDQFARWMQVLEETYYTMEIRKGSAHCNADAMSRLYDTAEEAKCEGKRCICPGVKEQEKHDDTTDDYRTHSAAFDMPDEVQSADDSSSDSEVDEPRRRQPPPKHPANKVDANTDTRVDSATVNAFKFSKKWSAREIADAQRADPDLQMLYDSKATGVGRPASNAIVTLSEAARTYFHDYNRIKLETNGVLYRQWESSDGTEHRSQMLLPAEYREAMFRNLHDAINAAHMGKRRTFNKLLKKYYWFRMGEDVKHWIKACPVCQRRQKGSKQPRAPLQTYVVGMPNERLAMDIIDHLPKTTSGNVCVLTMVDQFTKYAKAVPLPNQKKETIASAVMKHWITIFGTPYQIHTDQGPNFESGLMYELCDVLKIDKSRTTPYHPSGNGGVERTNATVMNLVHSFARQDPLNWDAHMHTAMMGYNATKHTATGFEPNRLMFGRNLNMPADLMMPHDPSVHPVPVDEHVRKLEQRTRYAYQVARTNLKRAATAAKKYYDRKAHLNKYNTGDAVKIKVTRKFKGMKFVDKYEGPYYIIDQLGETTYRVAKSPKVKAKVLHHDLILPYFPTVEEGATNIDWVFEMARELAENRVSQTGSQTELSVPPVGDNALVLEVDNQHDRATATADSDTALVLQQGEQHNRTTAITDIGIEPIEFTGETPTVSTLKSTTTQTNIHLSSKMHSKELKNVFVQLVCLRASHRSISVLGSDGKRYYHVENYNDTPVDAKYGFCPSTNLLSNQTVTLKANIESSTYNEAAAKHRPNKADTREQGTNTRIVLGPIQSSMNLITQQAALKGFQLVKTQRGADLIDSRAQHQLNSRSMQTMLELPPIVHHSSWSLMYQQAVLASMIKDADNSTYPMVISPDQDPDDFGEATPRYDNLVVEEYIDVKWSYQPAYVAHDRGERVSVKVQTDIVLHTDRDDGPAEVIEQQARITGFELGERAVWQRPAATFLDDIQLCQDEAIGKADAEVGNVVGGEAPPRQGRKKVTVTIPRMEESIDIKPRKRGRPRKAPQQECAEMAMQTDVQINVVNWAAN